MLKVRLFRKKRSSLTEKTMPLVFLENPVKKYIILSMFFILISSCATEQKKAEPVTSNPSEIERLNAFFSLCEKDIDRAGEVIISKDLIKNLTHLRRMDYGGKKYYILEREAITEMINAVTIGIYSDYILINKNGTVVYTMLRDDIFGKNVKSSLKGTSFSTSYTEREKPVFINEAEKNPSSPYQNIMMFSRKLAGGKSLPGIFILQLDVSNIEKVLDPGTEVINSTGLYIVSHDKSKLMKPFDYFDKIKDTDIKNGLLKIMSNGIERSIKYCRFTFANINWLLISEEQK